MLPGLMTRMCSGGHYAAFGLKIVSALPLPELTVSPPVAAEGVPEISIHFESLAGEVFTGRADSNEFILDVSRVARYRIRGGREIAIDPHYGSSEREIRLFLLGSAMGILCHQRRLLPLHANAIVINGSAVAFAGRTGIGKSTLAAHFQARGYEVLCDDVCVVGFDEEGRPQAWPGLPRLKLWRDAAEAFGHDSRNLEPAVDGLEKYQVPLVKPVPQNPYPLTRLYILSDLPPRSRVGISRLTGTGAHQAIMSNTYRHEYLGPMGLAQANFAQAASMARYTRIFAAPRERGYYVFAREAARLESHLMQMDTAMVGNAGDPASKQGSATTGAKRL